LHAEFSEADLIRGEEPMGILRKIRKYEYGNDSDQDRQGASDKKQPPGVTMTVRDLDSGMEATNLHAAWPNLPCIPLKMAEAMSEPNALLMRRPHESSAVRSPSSDRLYHFERRKRAPGKKEASTKPRKNRVRRAAVKLWAVPTRT